VTGLTVVAVLSAMVATPLFAESVTVHLRLIDGRSGKEFTAQYEHVWYAGTYNFVAGRSHKGSGIDALVLENGASIWVAANGYHDCRPDKDVKRRVSYAVDDITKNGIVTRNECGNASAAAKPGELILFVRPLNWWESRRD
jgi:hypothetical protein